MQKPHVMAFFRLGCCFASPVCGTKRQFYGNNVRYSSGSIGSGGKIFLRKSKIKIAAGALYRLITV
jgi:hypothetical protein